MQTVLQGAAVGVSLFEDEVARMPTALAMSLLEVFVARMPTVLRGAAVRVSVSLGSVDASCALSWGPVAFCGPFWESSVTTNSPDVMCFAFRVPRCNDTPSHMRTALIAPEYPNRAAHHPARRVTPTFGLVYRMTLFVHQLGEPV